MFFIIRLLNNSYPSVFVLKYMSDELFSLHVVKFARLNTKIEIQLLNFNCIILTHQKKKKKKTGKTRDLPAKHGPYNNLNVAHVII